MKQLSIYAVLAIILSGTLMGGAFYFGSAIAFSLITIVTGVIWISAVLLNWSKLNLICFVSFTFLAVYGLGRDLNTYPFLVGELFALAAWDLAHLRSRIAAFEINQSETIDLKIHYQYLVLALGLGLSLILLTLNITVQLSFLGALALGILLLLSFRGLVRQGTRDSE